MELTLSALTREAAVLYMSIEHSETLERIYRAEVAGDLEISCENRTMAASFGNEPGHVSISTAFISNQV